MHILGLNAYALYVAVVTVAVTTLPSMWCVMLCCMVQFKALTLPPPPSPPLPSSLPLPSLFPQTGVQLVGSAAGVTGGELTQATSQTSSSGDTSQAVSVSSASAQGLSKADSATAFYSGSTAVSWVGAEGIGGREGRGLFGKYAEFPPCPPDPPPLSDLSTDTRSSPPPAGGQQGAASPPPPSHEQSPTCQTACFEQEGRQPSEATE